MAITSGFYNALNHDRQYEATQIGSIFDGIIEDGIYETIGQKFMVTASGNGLVVNVGTGRAWFDHTWTLNDAILPIEMDEAELVLDRIDAVVLEVDASLSGRTNAVKTVKGTPSSNPVKPTLINTEEVHQYPLAYVSIKAEQTLIEQSDIENAVGTSATPFVIGVMEMMDVDALIAQWQTQFENMMRDDQQDFTNWEILVKASYEAWFAGVQAQMEEDIDEFETWESTTKTTFDAWFQNLQDELDENQAAHLQRQIGNLNALETSAKSDLVSAINEVNGRITTSISEILIDYDESMVGVEVTLSHTASAEGHTPETYTRTLEEPEPGMPYEIEVDVKNLGEWVISWTHEGQSYTNTLDIHYYGYYHVVLHEGFTWREWVVAGGISILKHDSLASLLADEEDVRRLFLVHNAVDYMVEKGDNRSECSTIINNDLCAKWINLSDYALDYLYTNTSLKSLMDTADKYFYGEWVYDGTSWGPKGNVPVMTSNSAPYGEVSASSTNSGYDAYRAFDGNDSDGFLPATTDSSPRLIYKFTNPVCPKKILAKFFNVTTGSATSARTIKAQGSNDGSTWVDLGDSSSIGNKPNSTLEEVSIDANTNEYYMYLAINASSALHIANNYIITRSLQFYGRELKVSVPTMTSNTAPYGEASVSDMISSTYDAWKAFDGNGSTYWQSNTLGNWAQYKFNHDVVLGMVAFQGYSVNNTTKTYQIFGIDSENNAELIHEGTWQNVGTLQLATIENSGVYKGFRYKVLEDYGTGIVNSVAVTLQFYGKDYSEKEFANDGSKWFYDHGVELKTIGYSIGTGGRAEDLGESLYSESNGTQNANRSACYVNLDLTPYSLARVRGVRQATQYASLGVFETPTVTTVASATANGSKDLPDALGLDISTINAQKYLSIQTDGNGAKFEVAEFWLE